jgi:hypothetical protein
VPSRNYGINNANALWSTHLFRSSLRQLRLEPVPVGEIFFHQKLIFMPTIHNSSPMDAVLDQMLDGCILKNKRVYLLGGNDARTVRQLKQLGAERIVYPISDDIDLALLASQDLHQISYIICHPSKMMKSEELSRLFDLALPGCVIIATFSAYSAYNHFFPEKRVFQRLVQVYGRFEYVAAPLEPNVSEVTEDCVILWFEKPGASYDIEFDNYLSVSGPKLLPKSPIKQDTIKEAVAQFISAMKLYDRQLETAVALHQLMRGFFDTALCFTTAAGEVTEIRAEFKRDLTADAWEFILERIQFSKYSTAGEHPAAVMLRTKFEQRPFTMLNIYKLLKMAMELSEKSNTKRKRK